MLARVASFPGGFDLGTAEQVAADGGGSVSREEVLDLIAALVDKSLLTTVDRGDGELRYRLLETIRAYAADQLDDIDFERTTERILRWAVELAETVEKYIDPVAERITTLGGFAAGTIRRAAAASSLPEFPDEESTEDLAFVLLLTERFAHCASVVGKAIDYVGEFHDQDTVDLLTDVSRDLDQKLWFLEAHTRQ